MLHSTASDRVWKLLIDELHRRIGEGKSENAVAKELGLAQSTVSSWLHGTRGSKASLEKVIEALKALEVPMSKIVEAMSGEDASSVIKAYDDNPDLFLKIVKILSSEGPEVEKLRTEVNYLSDKHT